MASLFPYMKQVQRFIRDSNQKLMDPGDIVEYVNQARREVAMRGEAIRFLTPISGAIQTARIINGGTGYSNPSVQISAPDSPGGQMLNPNGAQATALAEQVGGKIVNVNITYGGDGYFQPLMQIVDPTGTGAEIAPVIQPIVTANFAQEVYNFSDVDLTRVPGVKSIYTVRSISLLYANGRYSALVYSFTQYQALIRQYGPGMYYYVPCFAVQYGRGAGGSLYLYPPPSQTLQMEWDCSGLPSDLETDQDYEAIPDPWTDAVAYYAAHLAFLELQNANSARMYLDLFDQRMHQFGMYTLRGRAVSAYGRP
jgi:hypothetical protein